jgi:hypothetical protein
VRSARPNVTMPKFSEKLQGILNYEGCTNYQFRGNGIGKIGTSGFILGFIGGDNAANCYVSIVSEKPRANPVSSSFSQGYMWLLFCSL